MSSITKFINQPARDHDLITIYDSDIEVSSNSSDENEIKLIINTKIDLTKNIPELKVIPNGKYINEDKNYITLKNHEHNSFEDKKLSIEKKSSNGHVFEKHEDLRDLSLNLNDSLLCDPSFISLSESLALECLNDKMEFSKTYLDILFDDKFEDLFAKIPEPIEVDKNFNCVFKSSKILSSFENKFLVEKNNNLQNICLSNRGMKRMYEEEDNDLENNDSEIISLSKSYDSRFIPKLNINDYSPTNNALCSENNIEKVSPQNEIDIINNSLQYFMKKSHNDILYSENFNFNNKNVFNLSEKVNKHNVTNNFFYPKSSNSINEVYEDDNEYDKYDNNKFCSTSNQNVRINTPSTLLVDNISINNNSINLNRPDLEFIDDKQLNLGYSDIKEKNSKRCNALSPVVNELSTFSDENINTSNLFRVDKSNCPKIPSSKSMGIKRIYEDNSDDEFDSTIKMGKTLNNITNLTFNEISSANHDSKLFNNTINTNQAKKLDKLSKNPLEITMNKTNESMCHKCEVKCKNFVLCKAKHLCCDLCLQKQIKSILIHYDNTPFACTKENCFNFYDWNKLHCLLPEVIMESLTEHLENKFQEHINNMLNNFNYKHINLFKCLPYGNNTKSSNQEIRINDTKELNNSSNDEEMELLSVKLIIEKNIVLETNEEFKMLELNQKDFNCVSSLFYKTMSPSEYIIVNIQRIYNFFLSSFYNIRRQQMACDFGSDNGFEKLLFHGVREVHINTICKKNFDWRVCGISHGIMYGQGTYFARDASYAHQYTDRDDFNKSEDTNKNSATENIQYDYNISNTRHNDKPKILHYMFLARVLVGRFTLGKLSYKKPPPLNPNDPNSKFYDSCVNYLDEPTLFAISDPFQHYPEFLITYERSINKN